MICMCGTRDTRRKWFIASLDRGSDRRPNLAKEAMPQESYRATAAVIADPKTKRDRVAEWHYITCGARNVEDANFEVS